MRFGLQPARNASLRAGVGTTTTRPLPQVIADLYSDQVTFPALWPAHRRNAFTGDAADTAASELTTLLDNYLDTHVDGDVTISLSMLTEDYFIWQITELLPALVDEQAIDDPGRGEGSMTACRPTRRLPAFPRPRARRYP